MYSMRYGHHGNKNVQEKLKQYKIGQQQRISLSMQYLMSSLFCFTMVLFLPRVRVQLLCRCEAQEEGVSLVRPTLSEESVCPMKVV